MFWSCLIDFKERGSPVLNFSSPFELRITGRETFCRKKESWKLHLNCFVADCALCPLIYYIRKCTRNVVSGRPFKISADRVYNYMAQIFYLVIIKS